MFGPNKKRRREIIKKKHIMLKFLVHFTLSYGLMCVYIYNPPLEFWFIIFLGQITLFHSKLLPRLHLTIIICFAVKIDKI